MFDNQSVFAEWFSEFVGQAPLTAASAAPKDSEAAWFLNEKRMLVITRLHQILEPFMLRRMVRGAACGGNGGYGGSRGAVPLRRSFVGSRSGPSSLGWVATPGSVFHSRRQGHRACPRPPHPHTFPPPPPQLQDVEGKLPPKIVHVVKCPLSGPQAAMYDWIKGTGSRCVKKAARSGVWGGGACAFADGSRACGRVWGSAMR